MPAQRAFTLVCLSIACLAYWPALSGPFLFDSIASIRDNPMLLFENYTFDEWYSAALSSDTGPLRRPLAMLSFALNAALSGLGSAFPFKLTNLLLHCVNAGLVFACVRELYRASPVLGPIFDDNTRVWLALFAAAIFLLHPMQVTVVLHCVQRMTELAFSFQLIAMLVFLRGRPMWALSGAGGARLANDATWIFALTILGALSKENALLTPWMILTIEIFFFWKRVNVRVSAALRGLVIAAYVLPVLAVALLLLMPDYDLLKEMYAGRDFSPQQRLMTQSQILWLYLYWFFAPGASATGMHHDDIAVAVSIWQSPVALSVAAWILVIAILISGHAKRWPMIGFAFAWFLVAHTMESTIVPLEMVFEHRNYPAMFGFVILLGHGLMKLRSAAGGRIAMLAGSLACAVCVIYLALRAAVWVDEATLVAHQLAEHPNAPRSLIDYGNSKLRLASADGSKDAVLQSHYAFTRAMELEPTSLLPITKLLMIDAIYFQGRQHEKLFESLIAALNKRVLTTTDRIALEFFVQCSISGYCAKDRHEYFAIIRRLDTRADISRARTAAMEARYFAEVDADYVRALSLIRPVIARHGSAPELQMLIIPWEVKAGQFPAAIESARQLYTTDQLDRRVRYFRRLFIKSDAKS